MTAVVYSDKYRLHDTGNHVENEMRVQVVMKAINEMDILDIKDIYQ